VGDDFEYNYMDDQRATKFKISKDSHRTKFLPSIPAKRKINSRDGKKSNGKNLTREKTFYKEEFLNSPNKTKKVNKYEENYSLRSSLHNTFLKTNIKNENGENIYINNGEEKLDKNMKYYLVIKNKINF